MQNIIRLGNSYIFNSILKTLNPHTAFLVAAICFINDQKGLVRYKVTDAAKNI